MTTYEDFTAQLRKTHFTTEQARKALQKFIEGKHSLHVPPLIDDPDMVIGRVIDERDELAAKVEKLEAALADSGKQIAEWIGKEDDFQQRGGWKRLNELEQESPILAEIHAEFLRASSKFPPMNSAHEGYAILLEEVDELWEAVKKNDTVNMREEAVQVGAMALRFIVNVLLETKK